MARPRALEPGGRIHSSAAPGPGGHDVRAPGGPATAHRPHVGPAMPAAGAAVAGRHRVGPTPAQPAQPAGPHRIGRDLHGGGRRHALEGLAQRRHLDPLVRGGHAAHVGDRRPARDAQLQPDFLRLPVAVRHGHRGGDGSSHPHLRAAAAFATAARGPGAGAGAGTHRTAHRAHAPPAFPAAPARQPGARRAIRAPGRGAAGAPGQPRRDQSAPWPRDRRSRAGDCGLSAALGRARRGHRRAHGRRQLRVADGRPREGRTGAAHRHQPGGQRPAPFAPPAGGHHAAPACGGGAPARCQGRACPGRGRAPRMAAPGHAHTERGPAQGDPAAELLSGGLRPRGAARETGSRRGCWGCRSAAS